MKLKSYLFACIIAIVLCGCGATDEPAHASEAPEKLKASRIALVETVQHRSQRGHWRYDLSIIRDTKTGTEYLVVEGVSRLAITTMSDGE